MLTVRDYMTPEPACIAREEPLAQAHRLMQARGIRHLPVLDRGRLIGVVSERDLYLLETLRSVNPAQEPVSEAMSEHPWTVSPGAPLAVVAAQMCAHKYGCAVVVEDGRVVGVFTTIDALRALRELLDGSGR